MERLAQRLGGTRWPRWIRLTGQPWQERATKGSGRGDFCCRQRDIASPEARSRPPIRGPYLEALVSVAALSILEDLIEYSPAQSCAFGVDWPTFLAQCPHGRELELLIELDVGVERKSVAQRHAAIAPVSDDEVSRLLAEQIRLLSQS